MRFQIRVKLNDIRHTDEAKLEGAKTKTTGNTNTWPTFRSLVMDTLMHVLAFYRQPVLLPNMLNVNQSTLPFAEQQVLKSRESQQFVFGIHQIFNLLSLFKGPRHKRL